MPKRSYGDFLLMLFNNHLASAAYKLEDVDEEEDFQAYKETIDKSVSKSSYCFEVTQLENVKFHIEQMIKIKKQLYFCVYDDEEDEDSQPDDCDSLE